MHTPSELLETAFERLTGKISLALTFAKDASLIGLKAWMELHKIQPGTQVIVSGLDNDTVIQNCLHLGLSPVIADVDVDTLQPTLETIKATGVKLPAAILVRSYAGYPCAMDDLYAWCKARRITLMDDATDCLPSKYKTWGNAGWPSDLTFFRFSEGGILAMRDMRLYGAAKAYRTHMPEHNAKKILDEVHDITSQYERRRQMWQFYTEAFEDIESLDLPWEDSRSIKQACSRYPLRVHSRQQEIAKELIAIGMSLALPLLPIYMGTSWEHATPKVYNVLDYMERGLTLPMHVDLTDAAHVVQIVKSIVV